MIVDIHCTSLVVNGVVIKTSPPRSEIVKILGQPDRVRNIISDRKPWRNVLYFDHLGVILLEDLPDQTICEMRFVLVGDGSERSTKSDFRGQITLNKKKLGPMMKKADIPLVGEFTFEPGIGNSFKARAERAFVSLELKRLKNLTGKSAGRYVLFEVSYGFQSEK